MLSILKPYLDFFGGILKLWPYILAAAFAILISYHVGHYRGYHAGKEVYRVKTIEKDLDRSKKNAAIRNNRPSASGVVNRLRQGNF